MYSEFANGFIKTLIALVKKTKLTKTVLKSELFSHITRINCTIIFSLFALPYVGMWNNMIHILNLTDKV